MLLLGTAYYRAGQTARCYAVLRSSALAESRYLFARCCLDLNKLQEAELAITGALLPEPTALANDVDKGTGMAYALLGHVHRRSGRQDQAAECYTKALHLNPCLWSSYEYLCRAGRAPEPDTIFLADDRLPPPLLSVAPSTTTMPMFTPGSTQQAPARGPVPAPFGRGGRDGLLLTPG